MKKLYFMKLIFTLFLTVMISQITSAQKKKILYVGADAYYSIIRSADKQMVDSLVYWGYDTAYMAMAVYDAGGGVNSGIDGIFFGESCGSNSVTPYGKNGDNFPVPAMALEAAAFGVEVPERWNLFKEESSVGALDGGGIVVHTGEVADATDNQIKITDNSHYITEIYQKDQIITWSNSTSYALVPYIQGIKYDVDILAVPVAPFTAPANGEEVYAMGMIENNFPKIKIFWFTNTHTLLNDNMGTPEFYQLMKRAAEYTFDNIPQPNALKENNFTGFNFVAYPNPASGEVTIRFNAPELMQAQIVLLDIAGRQIDIFYENITHIGNNFVILELGDYQKGIYFVKLQMGENSAYSKILLK